MRWFRCAVLTALSLPMWGAPNILTVIEKYGVSTVNYPVQIGRVFVEGEISDFPQAGICRDAACSGVDSWLPTQAEVKSRWPGGSVKFALVSFLIPKLDRRASVAHTFRNQKSCNCGPSVWLNKSQMLDPAFDFEASIELTQAGATQTASARRMLSEWSQTTLVAGVDGAATSLTVARADGFPSPPFRILIDSEEMKVTSIRQRTNWTVVRGWSGTQAAAHANGAEVADTRVRYWAGGAISTSLILFDPITKIYDLGWERYGKTMLAASISPTANQVVVNDATGWKAPLDIQVQAANYSGNRPVSRYVETMHVTKIEGTKPATLTVTRSAPPHPPRVCAISYPVNGIADQGANVYPALWREPADGKFKSFRPYFYVTFWPAIHKVQVRFIGENTDTQRAQDLNYDLALKLGYQSPATVYRQTNYWHYWGTVWSTNHYAWMDEANSWKLSEPAISYGKELWIGGTPTPVQIDHGAAYLAASKAMPNYDASKKVSVAALEKSWASGTHNLAQWVLKGKLPDSMDESSTSIRLTGFYQVPDVPFGITVGTGAGAEDMVVQGRFGPVFAVARGVNGTNPVRHKSGAPIVVNRRFNDPGNYWRMMSTGGANDFSGPYPGWSIYAMLSKFDLRQVIKSVGNAEIAGSWAMNFREGDSRKRLLREDAPGSGTGYGKPLSAADRKTFISYALFGFAAPGDAVVPVSVTQSQRTPPSDSYCSAGGFSPGLNHYPDPFSLLYATTGDPYYLDRLQFWTSFTATYPLLAENGYNGRGPSGDYASFPFAINGDSNYGWYDRETGWTLRYRAHAAFYSSDHSPEKAYAEQVLADGIASIEGSHGLTKSRGAAYEGTPVWNWAKKYQHTADNYGPLGLNVYERLYPETTWSGGEAQTYGIYSFGRGYHRSAPRGGRVGGPLVSPHAAGVAIYDVDNFEKPARSLTELSIAVSGVLRVTAAADKRGLIRVSTDRPHGLSNGDEVYIRDGRANGGGWPWAGNGLWKVTVVSPSELDLQGSTFREAYVGGSAILLQASFSVSNGDALEKPVPLPKRVVVDTGSAAELMFLCSRSENVVKVCPGGASWAANQFGDAYVVFALGRAVELGYKAGTGMLNELARHYSDGIVSRDFNPYLFQSGRFPTMKADGKTPITTWADAKAGYLPELQQAENANLGMPYRYMEYAFGATSFAGGTEHGKEAQEWMRKHVLPGLNDTWINGLKWAILPRP